VFTTQSIKSSSFYLILLVMVACAVAYVFWIRQPSVVAQYEKQGAIMGFRAFKESIRFAHYKYRANEPDNAKANMTYVDIWLNDEGEGLDFNGMGYPVGVNKKPDQAWAPLAEDNCIQIWRFLLGDVFPVYIKENASQFKDGIGVKVIDQLGCRFYAAGVVDLMLDYYPADGSVVFIDKSSVNS